MPNNDSIYNAVLSGVTGAVQERWLQSQDPASYTPLSLAAQQIALAVDSEIPAATISFGERNLMQAIAQGVFAGRYPSGTNWIAIAGAITALYTQVATLLEPESAGGGAVDSVFGRTGVVVAVNGDYTAAQVTNTSLVTGSTVSDALNTLDNDILSLTSTSISNVSGVAGASVTAALNTLNAPIDLTGARVVVGPANTFLASDGVTNQWLPVFNGPANPGDNGKVVIASGGNFTYFAGSLLGQALTWDSGTSSWVAGTDFGAQSLVTTGSLVINNGSGFIRLGLAPGSGSGVASASATGVIRGARGTNGFTILVRNNGDTGDVSVFSTDTVAGTLFVGSTGAGGFGVSLAAPSASSADMRAGSVVCAVSSTGFACSGANIQFSASVASGTFRINTNPTNGVTGVKLTITGQDCTGTTTTGGALDIRPGIGTTASGLGRILDGNSNTIIQWNVNTLGFFTTSPVTRRTLTDTTGGVAATTLVDVNTAGVADVAKVNANFASIRQLINQYGLC